MNISKFDIVRKGGSYISPEYGEGIAIFQVMVMQFTLTLLQTIDLLYISEDPRDWRRNDQTVALLKILKKESRV